jgi:hypothetical protein
MTREQYLEIRRLGKIDLNIFYDYYVQNVEELKIDFNAFQHLFSIYFQSHSQFILKHLDNKFNLYILEDKNGKEIKIW